MELHEAELTGTAFVKAKNDQLTIATLNDVHYGAEGCSTEALEDHVRWGVENNACWLGLGEMFDFASPGNRERLKEMGAKLFHDTKNTLQAGALWQIGEGIEILKPTRGKWIGMLEGHHFFEWVNEEKQHCTSDTELAEALAAPFLGTCALIHVAFPNRQVLKIWAHHGMGSGQTLGAPLNSLERVMSRWDAHIYLVAHQHKIVPVPVPYLYGARKGKKLILTEQRKIGACCGGFLRGYTQGSTESGRPRGGYVERKALPPTAVGGLLIKVKPAVSSEGIPIFEINVEF